MMLRYLLFCAGSSLAALSCFYMWQSAGLITRYFSLKTTYARPAKSVTVLPALAVTVAARRIKPVA